MGEEGETKRKSRSCFIFDALVEFYGQKETNITLEVGR